MRLTVFASKSTWGGWKGVKPANSSRARRVALRFTRPTPRLARHELDRRGARLGGDHRIDPLRAVMEVFAAVRRIDRIVERRIGGILEMDILLDAAGLDMAVALALRAAIPRGAVAIP